MIQAYRPRHRQGMTRLKSASVTTAALLLTELCGQIRCHVNTFDSDLRIQELFSSDCTSRACKWLPFDSIHLFFPHGSVSGGKAFRGRTHGNDGEVGHLIDSSSSVGGLVPCTWLSSSIPDQQKTNWKPEHQPHCEWDNVCGLCTSLMIL